VRIKPPTLYALAIIGGCLTGLGDAPGPPAADPGGTIESLAPIWRLLAGVLGFAFFFANSGLASGMPGPCAPGRSRHGLALMYSGTAAFLFAAVFLATTLYWLYDGAIEFFGSGAAAIKLFAASAVTIFIAALTLPFVILSMALTGAFEFASAHKQRATAGAFIRLAQMNVYLAQIAAPFVLIALIASCHRLAFGFAWFEFGQWLLDFERAGALIHVFGARWSGAVPLGFAAAIAPAIIKIARGDPPGRSAWVILRNIGLVCALLTPAAIALSLNEPPDAPGDRLRVALIAGVPPARGRAPRERVALHLSETLRFARSLGSPQEIDLILWPESVADETHFTARSVLVRRLAEAGLSPKADLWFGARAPAGNESLHNTIHSLREDRVLYRKRELVPFTERLPETAAFFRWLMPHQFKFTTRNQAELSPAPSGAEGDFHWRAPNGGVFAVSAAICYESAFARLISPPADRPFPGFIVNAGNETWFEFEILKRYTLRQARARALENRLPLVRIVSGGYSGLIDARGRVVRLLRSSSAQVLVEARP
jgi:apolipoprotein N-acyltransferase